MTNYNYIFSEDYFKSVIDAFPFKESDKGNCKITHVTVSKRIICYLYVEFIREDLTFPVLKIDGQTIMSLSPMEIQSHILPIEFANGRVGVGGLGLGYYVQSILDDDNVEQF